MEKIAFHCWHHWVEKEILDIAKEQRPDLYVQKKAGFMNRIKSIFGGKDKSNKNSLIENDNFIRTNQKTPEKKSKRENILSDSFKKELGDQGIEEEEKR